MHEDPKLKDWTGKERKHPSWLQAPANNWCQLLNVSEGIFDPVAQLILWLNGPVCVNSEDSCCPLTHVIENKKNCVFFVSFFNE